MRALHVARWMVSFADLALLLLAFFVLLHATGERGMAAAARAAFSDSAAVPPLFAAPAASLFEPGEARLVPRAREELARVAAAVPARSSLVVLSEGRDGDARRFDSWELAAARTAALARALGQSGIADERIVIRMPEHEKERRRQELTIRLAP